MKKTIILLFVFAMGLQFATAQTTHNITWRVVVPSGYARVMDLSTYQNVAGRTISKSHGSTSSFAFDAYSNNGLCELWDITVNGDTIDWGNDPDFQIMQGYYQYTINNLQTDMYCVAYYCQVYYMVVWNWNNGGMVRDVTRGRNVTRGDTLYYFLEDTITFSIIPDTAAGYDLQSLLVNGSLVDLNNDPNFYRWQGFYRYKVTNSHDSLFLFAVFNQHQDLEKAVTPVVKLQPNPAASFVTLTIEGANGEVDYSLIDLSGRIVRHKTVNAESAECIDLHGLANGTYFVRVTNESFSKVEKLVVRGQ